MAVLPARMTASISRPGNLGAATAINYKTDDFGAGSGDRGADVILDMVGWDHIARSGAAAYAPVKSRAHVGKIALTL